MCFGLVLSSQKTARKSGPTCTKKVGFCGEFPYLLGSGDYHDKSPKTKSMRLPQFPQVPRPSPWHFWQFVEVHLASKNFIWRRKLHPQQKHHGLGEVGLGGRWCEKPVQLLMVSMWRNLKKPMQSRDSGHPIKVMNFLSIVGKIENCSVYPSPMIPVESKCHW